MNDFSDDDSEDQGMDGMDYQECMQLLENIRSGKAGYVDTDDIIEAYDILMDNDKGDEAIEVLSYGISQHPNRLLLTKATSLTNTMNFQEAQNLLDYLRPAMEDVPLFHVNIGWLMLQQGNKEKAVESFEKAIGKAGTDDERCNVKYEICSNLYKMNYYEEAIHFFKKMTKKELLYDYDTIFDYAYALGKVGRHEESKTVYEAILEKWPMAANAWYNIGIMEHELFHDDAAMDAFNNAIAIKQDYAEAYFNLGNIYNDRGDLPKAIEYYTDYIAYCVEQPSYDAYAFIGDCWERLGDEELGWRFYKFALKGDPDQHIALYAAAQRAYDEGKYQQVVKMLNRALKRSPQFYDCYLLKADAQHAMLKTKECLVTLEKGLHYSPDDLRTWMLVVITHFDLEQPLFDPKKYVEKMLPKYDNPDALKVILAYFVYLLDNDRKKAIEILQDVAQRNAEMLTEASSYNPLSIMFNDKKMKKVVESWGVKLEKPEEEDN